MSQVWSEGDLALLRSLWSEGRSARAIGNVMGRSRNSIIGKVHRLGLYRGDEIKPSQEGKIVANRLRSTAMRPKPVKKVMLYPEKVHLPASIPPLESPLGGIPLMEARKHHCRAIIDTPDDPRGSVRYCGGTTLEGSSWCAHHAAIYTIPARGVKHGTSHADHPTSQGDSGKVTTPT